MSKTLVATKAAAAAVGPYSQAIACSGFVFVSGQLPLHPATGEMPDGIEAQTRQSLDNLTAILKAAGSSLAAVIKTTVFLKNMDEFAIMNRIYGEYFTSDFPARSTIEVAKLPRGALVEVEAIAHGGKVAEDVVR
jgi:2-iminobutanoate/2-iminopropanoate deaminase